MNPRVKSVVTRDDFKLEISFTNGEKGLYDCTPLLEFGVFRELKDHGYFGQAKAVDGTVAWPHGQDICPDTLYMNSKRARSRKSPKRALSLTE